MPRSLSSTTGMDLSRSLAPCVPVRTCRWNDRPKKGRARRKAKVVMSKIKKLVLIGLLTAVGCVAQLANDRS